MIPMGHIYSSPGVLDEILHLFFARGLSKSEQDLDDDEFINIEWIPAAEVENLIRNGEMTDAKGIIAFAKAQYLGLLD